MLQALRHLLTLAGFVALLAISLVRPSAVDAPAPAPTAAMG